MRFVFSNEDEALRKEVQEFISENLHEKTAQELYDAKHGGGYGEDAKALLAKIDAKGWNAVSWPTEYGGQGKSRTAQFIIEEEFYRAAQLIIGGGGTGAPAVLASGNEQQKRQFVTGSIRRKVVFCQGYSEPQCGTDLAGVRCRATRVDDTYVINGQKIYTTHAQNATHIFLLVRTDPDSTRSRGLSILLVPMDMPGITVRPLWTVQSNPPAPIGTTYGEPRTNEVFFEDVVVPASCLLGEEGDGWAVSQRGLNLDRVGAWRYLISVMRDEDIVNYLKSSEDPAVRGKAQNDGVRDKVAEMWIEGQVCRLMTMRSISIEGRGGTFTYEGSAEKVWAPEHGVRTTEAITQILGPGAQLLSDSPDRIEKGVYAHNLMGAYQSTVNHGSVQVMRDQIARKGLGMPRPRKAT